MLYNFKGCMALDAADCPDVNSTYYEAVSNGLDMAIKVWWLYKCCTGATSCHRQSAMDTVGGSVASLFGISEPQPKAQLAGVGLSQRGYLARLWCWQCQERRPRPHWQLQLAETMDHLYDYMGCAFPVGM
jgi:hypothetical protein